MTDREAQAALAEIVLELLALSDRLQRLHDRLPDSPGRLAMWEHRKPYDVATEIYGTIECVLADEIRPAVEHLEWAARASAEELRARWEKNRAIRDRLRGRL